MIHSPIHLHEISLIFPHKVCFDAFSTQIPYGKKIALIGQNGCGKSTLLKCLQGLPCQAEGNITLPTDANIGYVPQIIDEFQRASGGQRFQKALNLALSCDPNVLLLDEPTNHLDSKSKNALFRLLNAYPGTLIVATHDADLINECTETLWYIDNGIIQIYQGSYDNFMQALTDQRRSLLNELTQLQQQKKTFHEKRMQEQSRAKKSRAKGNKSIEQRKWPTIVSNAKANRASENAGKKLKQINNKKQQCLQQLEELTIPQIITPTFTLKPGSLTDKQLLCISKATIGYKDKCILNNLSFSVFSTSRIAILGNNGAGKSTLLKSLMAAPDIHTTGIWQYPKQEDIGFLDQHYSSLMQEKTVVENIAALVPTWTYQEIRFHLKDFLFCKNETVNQTVATLSGGEKARLCLAQIAAKPPKLLLLDEVGNNLDLVAKNHVINVLQQFPLAIVAISHEASFLKAININEYYEIKDKALILKSTH